MTPDQERYAEALAIERVPGEDAPHWIAERIGAPALADEELGQAVIVAAPAGYARSQSHC